MIEHRKGIICKTTKYGESSIITDIFSSEAGMRSYIISGVRSSKGKQRSAVMQVMNIVDFVAYDTKEGKKGLSRIKEIKYDYIYRKIPFDIIRSSIGIFLIEIVRKSLKISEDNVQIFKFVSDQFKLLDSEQVDLPHFHIRFLVFMARELGFAIKNDYSEEKNYFDLRAGSFADRWTDGRYMIDTDLSLSLHQYLSDQSTRLAKSQRRELLLKLVDFYRYHIDDFGEVRSLDVLHSLYS